MESTTVIEKDGMYFFSVTSDGATGLDWAQRIKSYMANYVINLLNSPKFKSTCGVTSNLVLVHGSFFGKISHEGWIPYKKMLKFAKENGLMAPSVETTGLVLQMLADTGFHEKMKILGLTIMHKPINDAINVPYVFSIQPKNNTLYLEITEARSGVSYPDWNWYVFEKA